ncbi:hypothetical protein ASPZODRAFT_17024 [Penicilliopsis zonata CBS 506.65]|uniref:Rhodopsin domain-containing protein n=1 Tax=Penicilliopsis zonata CBS 506.65 TaxID=1073090 RepID=A0A1L9SEC3_9EURO|nr:hypothetical protein ASPZODRAFT_17024 [Penicilliopsis zonata CBS 506.65]OJJ45575.1 hypothetical protein ASPZODRAFT_17024 [Penicilliopsis zonata CBS 506.65]
MASLGPEFGHRFAVETWTLYAVGVMSVVLRFIARIRRLGAQNLQADDYLMIFAVVWYTILCVALNQVASGGGSNLMDEAAIEALTPAIKKERIRGSKWVFVSEHSFILSIWAMKGCMLVIYARLTEGLHQRRWINWCSIYVACGFVGTELSLFLICRPLSQYWAVPASNTQCSTYQYYEIVQGCFSISADILMLMVAIPLLMQVRVPLKQKLILLLLFGMGVFVIVAAVLNKLYCLVPSLISYVYMNWYFREVTVAILVTNLPLIWSLLRDVFPAIKSWSGGSKRGTSSRYHTSAPWTSKGSAAARRYAGNSTTTTTHAGGLHSQIDIDLPEYNRPSMGNQTGVSKQQQPDEVSDEDDSSARALRIHKNVTVTVERELEPETWGESTRPHSTNST